MIIEVSSDVCFKEKLTLNQYVILNLFYNKNYSTISRFINEFDFKSDIEGLIKEGYIIGDFNLKDIKENNLNRSKIKSLFKVDDSLFWEFFSTYPIKVPGRNGGTRYLRSTSIDALETKKQKKKYESIIGKKVLKHKHIIKCLEAELFVRNKESSLKFMLGMSSYLNQEYWTRYEGILESMEITKSESKYGEELI